MLASEACAEISLPCHNLIYLSMYSQRDWWMTFFVLLLYKLHATGTMLKHGIRDNLNLCSWATSVTKLHSFFVDEKYPIVHMHFSHPLLYCWMQRLVAWFSYCDWCCIKHWCASISALCWVGSPSGKCLGETQMSHTEDLLLVFEKFPYQLP